MTDIKMHQIFFLIENQSSPNSQTFFVIGIFGTLETPKIEKKRKKNFCFNYWLYIVHCLAVLVCYV